MGIRKLMVGELKIEKVKGRGLSPAEPHGKPGGCIGDEDGRQCHIGAGSIIKELGQVEVRNKLGHSAQQEEQEAEGKDEVQGARPDAGEEEKSHHLGRDRGDGAG